MLIYRGMLSANSGLTVNRSFLKRLDLKKVHFINCLCDLEMHFKKFIQADDFLTVLKSRSKMCIKLD